MQFLQKALGFSQLRSHIIICLLLYPRYIITTALSGGFIVVLLLYLAITLHGLPTVTTAAALQPPESTMILDRQNNPLFAAYNKQDRKVVQLNAIPPHVQGFSCYRR